MLVQHCYHFIANALRYLIVQLAIDINKVHNSMVSCQKGPTSHAYAWQIGPFWQDTLDMPMLVSNELNSFWPEWYLGGLDH